MNRKEIKEFLETLHFHGYIDHDITKLDNLIDDYYPKQLKQAHVSGSLPFISKGKWVFERSSGYAGYRCEKCYTWIYENQEKKCYCDSCNEHRKWRLMTVCVYARYVKR